MEETTRNVTLKVRRYNPEDGKEVHYDTFNIPNAESNAQILDLLVYVQGHLDGTLAFRKSCSHGVCGSDAMRINGKNRLACKTLVQDIPSGEITVEPILGLAVIKDLIVDQEPFFNNYKAVLPYFMCPDDPVPDGKERLQSPEQRMRYDDTTKCILCAACTTSCPVFWAEGKYVGPAAIVQAHRFIFDSRDCGAEERLKILNQGNGVWSCRTAFNCTEACPRDIQITKAIAEVKRALQKGEVDYV
jgi:succinate dehydrogenase / fumarate reductase iron-sulfur subunit